MQVLPRASARGKRLGASAFRAWLAVWLQGRRRERQSAPPAVPVPNAPSNLTVSVEEGFFILMWQDNSNNETGFLLYRKAFSGVYRFLDVLPANTTVYADFDVEPGVFYTWYVVACNAGGESARSNEWGAQLPGA